MISAVAILMIGLITLLFSPQFILEDLYKVAYFLLLISTFCLVWFGVGCLFPHKLESVRDLKIYEVDGIKCVSYHKGDGKIETINLNKKFNKQIKDNESVRLTKYKSGPYAGLDFDGIPDYNRYKLELVPASPDGEKDAEL